LEPDAEIGRKGAFCKGLILYYDPFEGAYGVQGRSLDRGVQGYFDER